MWVLLLAAIALAEPPLDDVQSVASYLVEDQPCRWRVERLPELRVGEQGVLSFRLNVPPDHHVYREALEIAVISSGGLTVGETRYPAPVVVEDPDFGPQLEYRGDVVVEVPITATTYTDAPVDLVVALRHQGCSVEVCHPPREATEKVRVPVKLKPAAPQER
ncbi:MAG: protein-disulfide reductase DsbD N-terminal domain-containing protein [Deltaproteobacteria bacterium]|nr:protein-disulfide reductase DsbD N-terminal domain-containing protein [Deltaproteobacteria bacterium]